MTRDQRVQHAIEGTSNRNIFYTLRTVMNPDFIPQAIEFPMDLRGTKRPTAFNKKKDQESKKKPKVLPPAPI